MAVLLDLINAGSPIVKIPLQITGEGFIVHWILAGDDYLGFDLVGRLEFFAQEFKHPRKNRDDDDRHYD